MKKVLFASTALVMTAGVAAADVTVSGSANMGIKSVGGTTTVANEIDFDIKGSGSTDSGISFGASMDLDGDTNITAANTFTSGVSDPEVFISYEGLTLTVGNVGEAQDQGGLADVGYDGIGIDDIAEVGGYGAHDVHVAYSFGDVAVSASSDSDNADWGVGMSASFDAISVAVGFGETGGANQTVASVGYSAGAVSANVYYADNGTISGQGIDVSYTSGDITVTAVYAERGATNGYGIGFAYDLGGATLAGGFGENAAGTSVADLGVSFSF